MSEQAPDSQATGSESPWPLVSVVIVTHARGEMLRRALDSVLRQTLREPFEVWVLEDATHEGGEVCREMADQFAERDVPLTYIRMPDHSGYYAVGRNHALQFANGTYIAYLDDDNEWDPEHLEVLLSEIQRTEAVVVVSRWRYAGDLPEGCSRESGYIQASVQAQIGVGSSPMLNFADSSAIMHSRGPVRKALGGNVWNEQVNRFGDWHFICACSQANLPIHTIDQVTFTYWWHDTNLQLTRSPGRLSAGVMEGQKADQTWMGMAGVEQ